MRLKKGTAMEGRDVRAPSAQGERRERVAHSPYISGWFTEQFEAGVHPEYGYPKNHLPTTVIDDIEIVTGFFAQRASVK